MLEHPNDNDDNSDAQNTEDIKFADEDHDEEIIFNN